MSFFGKFSFCALLTATLVSVNGCSPADSSQMDEEKEPHYVLGKSRVNAMDYAGAVRAFTESLEVDPHSAAAHFQLACLFDTKEANPAAAIYHYQEYLRLDPGADNAEVIRQRIYSCKQQLAADVLPLPSAPAAQQQIEKLAEQNRQLQAQVDHLNEAIKQWNAYYAAQQNAARTSASSLAAVSSQPSPVSPLPDDVSTPTAVQPPAPVRAASARPAVSRHSHTVSPGETLASIARKSGVSLSAIQAANPGINPRKMRVGQVINLPER